MHSTFIQKPIIIIDTKTHLSCSKNTIMCVWVSRSASAAESICLTLRAISKQLTRTNIFYKFNTSRVETVLDLTLERMYITWFESILVRWVKAILPLWLKIVFRFVHYIHNLPYFWCYLTGDSLWKFFQKFGYICCWHRVITKLISTERSQKKNETMRTDLFM